MQKQIFYFLSFIICTLSAGQDSVNPRLLKPLDPELAVPVRELKITSSTLTEVPGFASEGAAQCDKDGNMFFHLFHINLNNMEVLKLKVVAGSAEPTLYKAPAEFTDNKAGFFLSFSVSPSGDLWMIGESRDREFYLFSFDSNGEARSKTRLDVPEHLDIRDFVVSDKGIMLVSGHFDAEAMAGLQGKSFVALIDPSGKIRKKLDLESEKFDFHAEKLAESGVVFGDDGQLYALEPSGIYVISQAGDLVRKIKFDKPPEFSAMHMAVSGGYIAVWLGKINKNGPITIEYLLLDASTGESLALYKPAAEMGSALCFSRKEGFTMRQIENQRVKLIMASPR